MISSCDTHTGVTDIQKSIISDNTYIVCIPARMYLCHFDINGQGGPTLNVVKKQPIKGAYLCTIMFHQINSKIGLACKRFGITSLDLKDFDVINVLDLKYKFEGWIVPMPNL